MKNQNVNTMESPAWDLNNIYLSFEDPKFLTDKKLLHDQTQTLKALLPSLESWGESAMNGLQLQAATEELLFQLKTFARSTLTVDGSNHNARKELSYFQSEHAGLKVLLAKFELLILGLSDEDFKIAFADARISTQKASWEFLRTLRDSRLSLGEEQTIAALSSSGLTAWGNLYDQICSEMKCHLDEAHETSGSASSAKTVGLAEALGMTKSPDSETRRLAWKSIQKSWGEQQENSAAILNALADFRLSVVQRRNQQAKLQEPLGHLDESLFKNRLSRNGLGAMMKACHDQRPRLQSVGLLMARCLGKDRLDPWDMLAPSPFTNQKQSMSFLQAKQTVIESFHSISSEMGEFAEMAFDKSWVEARVLPNKAGGAYCTQFPLTKEPRVFMSFMGSASDLTTLAHEMGHAYHAWVMRELTWREREVPGSLAETASVFAETVLCDHLMNTAKQTGRTQTELMNVSWIEADRALAFLLNIPVRFSFENEFYEKRKQTYQSAADLKNLMATAWKDWYGKLFTAPDELFWAHKLHFSLSETSFYNYSYTFGYLLALSLFSYQKEWGQDFANNYRQFLMDTGKLNCRDLVLKHLKQDLEKPEFWNRAIDNAFVRVDRFIQLANQVVQKPFKLNRTGLDLEL